MRQPLLVHSDYLDNNNLSTIQINSQYVNIIMPFLISNRISFHVNYQSIQMEDKHYNDTPQNTSKDNLPYKTPFFSQKNREGIENIHEEYIQKFPPKNIFIPKEETIASSLGMKVSRFRAIFKAMYGQSFSFLHLEKRMEYAKQLLRKGFTCKEVAKMVGYGGNSAIKFNKMFQKHFGITPKRYQLEHY
ncbi:helix-turn-helix domain-containing protein [Runella limosa]|uniref:helix-turn-helix domain-containing protein n=1 Tax=Runella limosa TaxID=370978 RepID=UPI000490F4F0|nr:AraC family transcriptional regulator [Runella limosa]